MDFIHQLTGLQPTHMINDTCLDLLTNHQQHGHFYQQQPVNTFCEQNVPANKHVFTLCAVDCNTKKSRNQWHP